MDFLAAIAPTESVSIGFALGRVATGLALFFTGIHFIRNHLKRLAGQRVKEFIGKLTGRALSAAVCGFSMGMIAQSSTGVLFLCVNLIASGLLKLSQAAVMMIWANVGISTIVLFATIDFDEEIDWLVGIAGILIAFERPKRWLNVVGLAFGVGLLLFGLDYIQHAAELMRPMPWFNEALAHVHGQYLLAFCTGAVLAGLAQSSAAVAIVAIVLAATGLLNLGEVLMIIYGTNVGDGLVLWMLSSNLRGSNRQLSMLQSVFNPLGVLIFVPLFYLEIWTGTPLVLALLQHVTDNLSMQGSLAFFLFNLGTAIPLHFLRGPLMRYFQKRYPVDAAEEANRPQFLSPLGLREPELAVEQVRRELQVLGRRLTWHLQWPEEAAGADLAARQLSLGEAFESVGAETRHFLDGVLQQKVSSECSHLAVRLLERLDIILSAERVARRLTPAIVEQTHPGAEHDLSRQLATGLEAALLTVVDALDSEQAEDVTLALQVTSDSGEAIARMREKFLQAGPHLTPVQRADALQVLAMCERLMFIYHSLARNLQPMTEAQPAAK